MLLSFISLLLMCMTWGIAFCEVLLSEAYVLDRLCFQSVLTVEVERRQLNIYFFFVQSGQ